MTNQAQAKDKDNSPARRAKKSMAPRKATPRGKKARKPRWGK